MSGRERVNRVFREDRMVCRHERAALGRWTGKDEESSYAPDRTCDVEHLRLECDFDLARKRVEAVCTQTLRAAYGPFDRIILDAHDLIVHTVRDGAGRDLPYTYLDRKLAVRFPEAVSDAVDLVISYRVEDPADGLFFLGPDSHEPDARPQAWSQNEDEGARHWIPCHDAPNERFTVEQIVTADEAFSVIANGRLVSCESRHGRRRWHYHEGVAIPSYLLSVVIGDFRKLEDSWNGIPVEYWVEPGREVEGRRSFGRTPDMLEFFSKQLDYPYPYEKYAQVAVRHFHFGGMENASATTQSDTTLHDERAALDFTSDDLVSHELAHQWFGDLITCKSWEHAWLNEGFATYFEALWKEWDLGREEFDYELVLNADSYLAEEYRRPIATSKYRHPFQLFDMHLYPKGGWVLHMLRRQLGDELFWKAIRLYVKRHAHGTAETIDLVRSFEEASGRNLAGFFSQWIHAPGHPQLEGEASWEETSGWVKVTLKQAQKRDDGTPLFHFPLRLEARLADGAVIGSTFEMRKAEQSFYLPLPAKPLWIALDPEGAVLCETKVKMPLEWAEAALTGDARDERVLARVEVVRRLGQGEARAKATALLRRVLHEDPFWGVRVEAADALAKFRTPAALAALVSATGLEHPKARRGVMTALGRFRDPAAAVALLEVAQNGDPSYAVQAAALVALGESGGPAVAAELREHLKEAMERRDWHDAIALGAVQGLAAARDEECFDHLLAAARDRSRYWNLRVTAARSLASIGAARPQHAAHLVEELLPLLDDPRILISCRTPGALVTLGHSSALAALRRRGETAPRAEDRAVCLEAAEALSAKLAKGEEVDRLRAETEKLREEVRELRQAVDQVKATLPAKKPAKLPAKKPAKRPAKTPAKKPAKVPAKGKAPAGRRPVNSTARRGGARRSKGA